jgi:hypothetical protein
MTLADFTSPGIIIPWLRGQDVATILQELSQALYQEKRVPDMPFYHAVLNREFPVNTDLEQGMAFPHARLAELSELSFALGRSPRPISWAQGRASGAAGLLWRCPQPIPPNTCKSSPVWRALRRKPGSSKLYSRKILSRFRGAPAILCARPQTRTYPNRL